MEEERGFRISDNTSFTTKRERELEIEIEKLREQLRQERTDANIIIGFQQKKIDSLSGDGTKKRCAIS